eukprot:SAG11_NODE_35490_length_266_cov_0.856287_1_plen_23_part_01
MVVDDVGTVVADDVVTVIAIAVA